MPLQTILAAWKHVLVFVAVASAAGLSGAPASAQSVPAAPVRSTVDANGVDLFYGTFNVKAPSMDGNGIDYQRWNNGKGWSDDIIAFMHLSGSTMTVSIGSTSDRFTVSGTTYTPTEGNGSTLSYNSTTQLYTYRRRDGTIARFDKVRLNEWASNGNQGLITDLATPSGEKLTFSYHQIQYCKTWKVGGTGYICTIQAKAYRLSTVDSSDGYRLLPAYALDDYLYDPTDPTTQPDFVAWTKVVSISGLNLASSTTAALFSQSFATGSSGGSPTFVVTDALGRSTTYRMSAAGQVVGIKRPGSGSEDVTIAYAADKVTSVTTPSGTTGYARSDAGSLRTVTVTDPSAHAWTHVFDIASQRLTAITDPLGHTISYSYDASGRLTRVTRPEGDYTNYTRDARGNVTETREVAKAGSGLSDNVATAGYDAACGNPATCNSPNWTQDALGNRTDYDYDATHGQVTKIRLPSPTADAAGTETGVRPEIHYVYTMLYGRVKNASGVLVNLPTPEYKVTQVSRCATAATCSGTAAETKVSIEYDHPNLLPTKVTTASGDGAIGSVVTYAYDAKGNLTAADGPLAGDADTTTYIYDALDRRRGAIGPDPDGAGARPRAATRLSFDTAGRVARREAGTATAASAAALDAMSVYQTVDIVYDANGNVTKETLSGTSGAVGVSQRSYDASDRLVCTALRMNPAVWGSLPASACTAATAGGDGPDRIARNSYDAAGRVTKVESAYGVSGVQAAEVTTAYTNNGQVDYAIDAENNRTDYGYDGHDRLVRTEYPSTTKGANTANAADYEQLGYDANGNVTSRRLRDGTSIGYGYDDLGQLVTKDLPGSEPDASYAYDLLGRPTTATQGSEFVTFGYDALGRNLTEAGPQGTLSYGYDAAGRRTSMVYPGGVLTIAYDYDVAGNVTAIRENGATSGVGVLASYAYDDLGRRSSVTYGNGSVQSFTYDPASRLSGLTNDLGGAATTHDLTQTFTYNPASQIANVTRSNDAYAWGAHYNVDRGYTIDGLNRIMNVGSTAFTYDGRGNLINDGTNTYTYTSENLLKTAPGSTTLAYDPLGRLYETMKSPTTTRFQYDGADLIAEYDAGNAIQRRYVHGPGSDDPIVWYEGGAIDGGTRWFLMADERGSIVSVSDSAGTAIAINAYDEYGIPAPTNIGRFGYTGQTWVPELGMWYYKARMYSPTLGRFLQSDPIGYADGLNWYNYVGSDPVNRTDPSGTTIVVIGTMVKPGESGTGGLLRLGLDLTLVLARNGNDGLYNDPPIVVIAPRPEKTPKKEKGLLDYARDAFCALPPIEISGGADAYLGIGASASLGISLDIRTLQVRGSVGATLGVGFGGGLGVGLGGGASKPGFATEITGTVAGGPGSITVGQGGVGGGTGPKFGPQLGAWGGVAGKYTTPATPDLTGACK